MGRNLVQYLLAEDLAGEIVVADKLMPVLSYMSPEHEEAFNNEKVTFIQADLTRDDHVNRAFGEQPFTFIINCAGETKYGQGSEVYNSRCRDLTIKCARKAAEMGCERFIEVSTGMVYKSQNKRPSVESAELAPWTQQARAKLEGDEALLQMNDLNCVILRPSIIYGPGDANGIMPRVTCAASYVKLGETMRFLWSGSMKINTVHVQDVVRAIWHATNMDQVADKAIYNLSDKSNTTQGTLNDLLGSIFNIRTGFVGTILSNMAKVKMSDAVDVANERHLKPWSELLAEHNISNSPLSPFIHQELLENNNFFINGDAIESTGFTYSVPQMTEETLREQIEVAIRQGIFPPVIELNEEESKS